MHTNQLNIMINKTFIKRFNEKSIDNMRCNYVLKVSYVIMYKYVYIQCYLR